MSTNTFDPVSLILEFDVLFEKFNLAYNFWTINARALIVYLSTGILKKRHFHGYQQFWPRDLTLEFDLLFETTLTLLKKTFEKWAQELLCFIWVFIVTEPFYEIQDLWPWTLESGFLFVYFYLVYNIWIVSARALALTFDQIFGKKTMVIFFKR